MTHPMEPVLARKPWQLILSRLYAEFGEPDAADAGSNQDSYRRAVMAEIRIRFGIPTPDALHELIDEAGKIPVNPDDLASFIGRQFRLRTLRRYSNKSN